MRGQKRKTGSIVLAAALFVLAVRLPAITVISPNGGESWVIGTPVTVRWSPTADGVNVRIILYHLFLETVVGEQRARMVAMKNAIDNADTMIKTLTRLYNRARQSQITNEISEIMGGVEALK